MPNLKLHIISFAIPDPPDYGGVIDVFYKIEALAEADVDVFLHCYQYGDRQRSQQLESLCKEVHYYKRDMSWRKAIGTTPFIMASRFNEQLIDRLKEDDYPILFEGMHTSLLAKHINLKNRVFGLRMHNIEWNYYDHLANQESNLLKKAYFKLESKRLFNYASILSKMNQIFTISMAEQLELSNKYDNCEYLPVFHSNKEVKIKEGRGEYILYHGNLDVAENKKAVDYIVSELYQRRQLDIPIIIAGKMNPKAVKAFGTIKYVEFKYNLKESEMNDLILNAQIHLLPTFQSTGIKLKLINALHKGRHCIVNSLMIEGTGLESLCDITDDADKMIDQIRKYWDEDFTASEIANRSLILKEEFSNINGAQQITKWLISLL